MNNSEVTEYLRKIADECVREKRHGDAVLLYRKLIALNPGEESLRLALAWAYLDCGMRTEAVECFERLLAIELERKVFTGFAFDELVRIFKEERQYERLVEICERVIAENPDDMGFLGDLGDAYLKAGKADKAFDVFKKMAKIEPDDSMVFCSMGNALIAMGDFDGADREYERAVKIDPLEAGTFYGRQAHVYAEAGCNERAERALRKCIEYRNDEPSYHCGLGNVLIRQGRLHEAELAYERAIELNRHDAGEYYNRFGNALAKEGHHLKAIDIFKKAISLDPQNPFYYSRLAESSAAAGLPDVSVKS
jgi:pentatricopeptide repeat protein